MANKAILLIPLTYNDGSRVPEEILDEIYDALFALCGGYTLAGTVRGAYRMTNGSKQTDVLEQVWVAYEEADELPLRELVARFCRMLGQETMYLEFTAATVELIPPQKEL